MRKIRIEGVVAFVPLTQGYEAIIDAADAPLVDGWRWCAIVARRADGTVRSVYAVRNDGPRGKARLVYMHRVIAGTPDGMDTDHISGNGLDNRRENLRVATRAQNQHNRSLQSNNTSGAKGVTWSKEKGKWLAQITIREKNRSLGYFQTIEDASAAYAAASAELHGEFGRTE